MVAKTGKERFLSLCGSGIEVFEERSPDEQNTVLDALQQFKDSSKVESLKQSVLGTPSQITLPALIKPCNPKGFFRTGQGLYIWKNFTDKILSVTKTVKSLPVLAIYSFDLAVAATDTEIRNELPQGHVWQDASAFCGYLVGIIQRQANGEEEGILLNNGYANIFYVVGKNSEVFVVRVSWDSDYREWSVGACLLGVRLWRAGRRAFSATAVA